MGFCVAYVVDIANEYAFASEREWRVYGSKNSGTFCVRVLCCKLQDT